MRKQKRSTFRITVELLDAIRKHPDWAKSKVTSSVRVNFTDRLPLIKHLIEKGFIKISHKPPERSKQTYKKSKSRSSMFLTEKGVDWIIKAKKLVRSLGWNDY